MTRRADEGKKHNRVQKYPSKLARRVLRDNGYRAIRTEKNEVKYFRRNSFTFILNDVFASKAAERKGGAVE